MQKIATLAIKRFRALRQLTLEGFGRVNLISRWREIRIREQMWRLVLIK